MKVLSLLIQAKWQLEKNHLTLIIKHLWIKLKNKWEKHLAKTFSLKIVY